MLTSQEHPSYPNDAAPVTVADAEQARARFALLTGDHEDAADAFDLAAEAYEAAGAVAMSAWCRRRAEETRRAAG